MPISNVPSVSASVSPPPPSTIARELRRGASGDDVRELQRLLGTHGFPVQMGGQFDAPTEAAVRAFQAEQEIGIDGIVGPITLGRLLLDPAPQASPAPDASPASPAPAVDAMDNTPRPPASVTGQTPSALPPAFPASSPAAPAPAATSLGAPGIRQTSGGAVRVREDTTALALSAQSPEHAQLVEDMRGQGFFPVRMADGSHLFMSNPSYAPDVNGLGVSSNEARAYAADHGLRLPTRNEANAFRAQAPVVMQFESGPTPGTANARTGDAQEARIAARLAEAGIPEQGVAIAGGTKIWALEAGRPPGLNGAVTNVSSGAALQSYSTVHGPDYEDYSQAAQFVHPTHVSANGTIVP